ncbi:MAG: septum formation initiator family protein [Nitrospirae bacterium]|nr:septum formation initiator family protein [Nitrospirota bacterium]
MARWNRSKETVERHQKLRRRIVWGIGLAVSVYLFVPLIIGDMGLAKYFKMRRTYYRLQQEIQHLSDENKKIEDEIRALRSDPIEIEQSARTRLGLVRPGETVYQFKPVSPSSDRSP